MNILHTLIDIFLHLDKNLDSIIGQFGLLSYVLLFLIIFMETGFVVTPFLPGDSLLFAAGTLAAYGSLNIGLLYILLLLAAIVGDSVNYWIGHAIGPKIFQKENSRFFKKEYLAKTQHFYEKYGGKTIILARFMPIIRTFAPFVAGIGRMKYADFILYNIMGGFLWVTLFIWGGYFFGNLPVIKQNFHYAIVGIIVLSILPGVWEYIKHTKNKRRIKEDTVSYKEIKESFKKKHIS